MSDHPQAQTKRSCWEPGASASAHFSEKFGRTRQLLWWCHQTSHSESQRQTTDQWWTRSVTGRDDVTLRHCPLHPWCHMKPEFTLNISTSYIHCCFQGNKSAGLCPRFHAPLEPTNEHDVSGSSVFTKVKQGSVRNNFLAGHRLLESSLRQAAGRVSRNLPLWPKKQSLTEHPCCWDRDHTLWTQGPSNTNSRCMLPPKTSGFGLCNFLIKWTLRLRQHLQQTLKKTHQFHFQTGCEPTDCLNTRTKQLGIKNEADAEVKKRAIPSMATRCWMWAQAWTPV